MPILSSNNDAKNPLRGFASFVYSKLGKNSFLRSTLFLISTNIIAQALPIILWPLITRLYSAEALGYLGLFTSFVTSAQVVVTLRYEVAIVSGESDREAGYLTLLAVLLVLPLSLAAAFFLFIMINANWLGYGAAPGAMAIFAVFALVFLSVFYTIRYWLLRTGSFKVIGQVSILQSTVRGALQALLGLLLGGAWIGLISGDVLGRAAGLTRMLRASMVSLRALILPLDGKYLLEVARKYWKYPAYSMPSSLINAVAIALPVPLIIQYFGGAAGGYFTLVLNTLALPAAVVGASVADVFHNRMALYARTRPDECLRFFMRITSALLAVSIVPAVIGALILPQLFTIVFGQQWQIAGQIAVTFIPLVVIQFVVNSLSRTVFIFGKLGSKLIYDLISLVSPPLTIWLCVQQNLDLVHTCLWLNMVNAATYLVYFGLLVNILVSFSRQRKTLQWSRKRNDTV